MRIALISCGKQKLAGTHRAKDLYISPLFRFAYAHAVRHFDKVFILSAKYGLLSPDEQIASYDITLTSMKSDERQRWAESVLLQMKEKIGTHDELHFFCGSKYRRHLVETLKATHECVVPFRGFGIGLQLQWYKRHMA